MWGRSVTGIFRGCIHLKYDHGPSFSFFKSICSFDFWAKEGKSVQFMTDAQIKAQEANDFKDRQAKRTRAKVSAARPLQPLIADKVKGTK